MNPSLSTSSDGGAIERLRGAYRQLSSDEKAKFVKFAARRRFTHDLFENWLRQSGVDAAAILRSVAEESSTEPLRERLDETLLMEGNEPLLIDAVTKYLTEGDPVLLASVAEWVKRAKQEAGVGAAGESEPPEELQRHPQGGLMTEALRGGLLDQALAQWIVPREEVSEQPETPEPAPAATQDAAPAAAVPAAAPIAPVAPAASAPVPVPADKHAALGQLDELEELMESVEADIRRIRAVSGPMDLGALERKLRKASVISLGVYHFAAEHGSWEEVESLRGVIEAIPDPHSVWATALADFLQEVPISHPLRRKREAAELLRDAAISELRNFADQGGVEEEVPGPSEEVNAWWSWATALSDEDFTTIEDWCSANSLDHLADFIAEQWTLALHQDRSTMGAKAAVRGAEGEVPAIDGGMLSVSRHGSLIAAMEVARRQAAGEAVADGDGN
jgi:hypothetical protein